MNPPWRDSVISAGSSSCGMSPNSTPLTWPLMSSSGTGSRQSLCRKRCGRSWSGSTPSWPGPPGAGIRSLSRKEWQALPAPEKMLRAQGRAPAAEGLPSSLRAAGASGTSAKTTPSTPVSSRWPSASCAISPPRSRPMSRSSTSTGPLTRPAGAAAFYRSNTANRAKIRSASSSSWTAEAP